MAHQNHEKKTIPFFLLLLLLIEKTPGKSFPGIVFFSPSVIIEVVGTNER
jgi:hypothetical protein